MTEKAKSVVFETKKKMYQQLNTIMKPKPMTSKYFGRCPAHMRVGEI